jgi:hypothetical protein
MKIEQGRTTSSVPFVCSLSKKVRMGMMLNGQTAETSGIKSCVISIVEQFDADAELKASLQQKGEPGSYPMRQIDVRSAPGAPIQLKVFMKWDWKLDMWHALVEGPDETAFEDGEQNF